MLTGHPVTGAPVQSQFDHIFSRRRREQILVKLTRGPQNDSRGHKNSAE
jgi:hypothetical protein